MTLGRLEVKFAILVLITSVSAWGAEPAAVVPAELVRRSVANQIKANESGARYMFRDRKATPAGSTTKINVQTSEAMVGMVVAYNDRPLNPEQQQGEIGRISRFIHDPEELKKKQKQEQDTADRITRILKALPDAFLYENDGTEIGKDGHTFVRLKFHPNPKYTPPTRIEVVLTEMRGLMLIDARQERIAKIDATLQADVSFGWGIVGHLDRGGHFLVEQEDVDQGNWAMTLMDLAFSGKILLFKSLVIKSTEVYSDFQRVATNLTFAQGVDLLKKQQAVVAENPQHVDGQPSK